MESYQRKFKYEMKSLFEERMKLLLPEKEDFEKFKIALSQHEIILSDILEELTIQESIFSDFDGVVKSLGAWGGDFILTRKFGNFENYFSNKNFASIFEYKNIII